MIRVKAGLLWSYLLALCSLIAGTASAAQQPNVLFIFADDQCFQTLRAYGYEDIDTPNLDRLAAESASSTPTPPDIEAIAIRSLAGRVPLAAA